MPDTDSASITALMAVRLSFSSSSLCSAVCGGTYRCGEILSTVNGPEQRFLRESLTGRSTKKIGGGYYKLEYRQKVSEFLRIQILPTGRSDCPQFAQGLF